MKHVHPSERPSPRGRSAAVVAVAFVLASATAAQAGEPAATSLFDGKSLGGWEKTDFANAGEVKVEDGPIHRAVGRPMTGITSTRKNLPRTNYELTYEAMRLAGRDFFAAATFPVGDS